MDGFEANKAKMPPHKFASSVNMYKFTHFSKNVYLSFLKNCLLRLLGQRPKSPSNNIIDVGYSFMMNVNQKRENIICIKYIFLNSTR